MRQCQTITAVVVLYNTTPSDSLTIRSLTNCQSDVDILIIDNSTSDYRNDVTCNELGFRYRSMNGNAGLSRAYNSAIDASPNTDVFVLLDDDTDIPSDYFSVLKRELNEKPDVDVFAPIVLGQDGVIWSPNNSSFLRNELVKDPLTQIDQTRFNAIASCLAIRRSVFDEWRFDERLFIDQVDQEFFDEQRERGSRFSVMPVTVRQSFYQRGDELTAKAGWNRLRLRIVDLMRHARMKESVRYTVLGYAKCCGLGLQIARKTKAPLVFIKAIGLATSCLINPR